METPIEFLVKNLKLQDVDDTYYLIGRQSISKEAVTALLNYEKSYLKAVEDGSIKPKED